MPRYDTNERTPHGPVFRVTNSWPDPTWRAAPGDELAAAVLEYQATHAELPPSPWDARRGEIHLNDEELPERDEPPQYRALQHCAPGGVYLRPGDVAPYHGWPRNLAELEPVNESAKRIVAYVKLHGSGALDRLPWDHSRHVVSLRDPQQPALSFPSVA